METATEDDAWLAVLASLETFDSPEALLDSLLNSEHGPVVDDARRRPRLQETPRVRASAAEDAGRELASTGKVKKKRKKRTVCPVKRTIEGLRQAVKDGEAHLELLHARQRQISSEGKPANGTQTDIVQTQIWKDVATRQFRWRRESEAQNDKLRTVLDEQTKIIQGLERLVKRSRGILESATPITYGLFDVEDTRYRARIHELLRITAEMGMYAHSSTDLRTMAVGGSPRALSSQAETNGATRTRIVPCSQQAITSAVWGYFATSPGETQTYFRERIELSTDMVVKSFRLKWHDSEYGVDHRGIVVARRFAHSDGLDVIVYTSELESIHPPPVFSSGSDLSGTSPGFRAHGWTLIRPHGPLDGGGECVASEVLFTSVTSPIVPAARKFSTEQTHTAKLVQFTLRRHDERVQRVIDDALMSAARCL